MSLRMNETNTNQSWLLIPLTCYSRITEIFAKWPAGWSWCAGNCAKPLCLTRLIKGAADGLCLGYHCRAIFGTLAKHRPKPYLWPSIFITHFQWLVCS